MSLFTEHRIGSYEELVEQYDTVITTSKITYGIRNSRLLALPSWNYQKLKPIYKRYNASKDKENFCIGLRSRSSHWRR